MADASREPPRKPHLSLETTEPMSFGFGFISGLLSAILGIAGFGAVLCLHFPQYLTHADLRAFYALGYLRAVIHVTLVASFLLASVSAFLRANKVLALTGLGFTLAAALLGGSQVPVDGGVTSGSWLGLDFFVLNLLVYSAVFVPLERLFALRRDQPVFRRQWVVDLTYFFVNSLLIEILTILTLKPALILFDWARVGQVSTTVGSLPLVVQVLAILLVADFTQVLGPPHVSHGALALALSRDPSLGRGDGLAGGIAAAPAGRDPHARAHVHPDLRAGILGVGADGVRRARRHTGDLHSCECPVGVPPAAQGDCHAGVSPLAPQRRTGGH